MLWDTFKKKEKVNVIYHDINDSLKIKHNRAPTMHQKILNVELTSNAREEKLP